MEAGCKQVKGQGWRLHIYINLKYLSVAMPQDKGWGFTLHLLR